MYRAMTALSGGKSTGYSWSPQRSCQLTQRIHGEESALGAPYTHEGCDLSGHPS